MVLFWWGGRYAVDILYLRCVAPLSCGGDQSPLFSMILAEEGLETGPCIEVGGLLSPLPNIFFEHSCLFQNGDPFLHNHCVEKILPSCLC